MCRRRAGRRGEKRRLALDTRTRGPSTEAYFQGAKNLYYISCLLSDTLKLHGLHVVLDSGLFRYFPSQLSATASAANHESPRLRQMTYEKISQTFQDKNFTMRNFIVLDSKDSTYTSQVNARTSSTSSQEKLRRGDLERGVEDFNGDERLGELATPHFPTRM